MSTLRGGQQKLETRLDAIDRKLEALPRVESLLNTVLVAIQGPFPRAEVEARFRDIENRIGTNS